MKTPLAIRFDREKVEKACDKLAKKTPLTKADVARAAMNIGLHELAEMKLFCKSDFSSKVAHWQVKSQ